MKRKLGALFSALLLATVFSISVFAETTAKTDTEYEIGSTLEFGTYEQDNNPDNGAEPIEWTVLDVQDGKVLVLSKYAIDVLPYHETREEVTWETCTLRKWLNEDFLELAFTEDEQEKIEKTKLVNEDNSFNPNGLKEGSESEKVVEGGEDTEDKVFLLSIADIIKYYEDAFSEKNEHFNRIEDLAAEVTEYAKEKGAFIPEDDGIGFWWLRSPGFNSEDAADVENDGYVNTDGYKVDGKDNCVRPALWLDLE